MKKRFAVVAMVGVGLFAGNVHAQSKPPAQRQIEVVMTAMAHAAKNHDATRFMAGYQHGPDLIFVINGEVIQGWDALYAQQVKWWRGGKSDVVYTPMAPTRFLQLGPDAWVTTLAMSSRRTGPDGKVATGTFAVTDIWRKGAQGWRIVYAHESWKQLPG